MQCVCSVVNHETSSLSKLCQHFGGTYWLHHQSRSLRQYVHPKRWYSRISLHDTANQKIAMLICTAVKTQSLKCQEKFERNLCRDKHAVIIEHTYDLTRKPFLYDKKNSTAGIALFVQWIVMVYTTGLRLAEGMGISLPVLTSQQDRSSHTLQEALSSTAEIKA